MPEHQTHLPLDTSPASEPVAASRLRDEVAHLWSLPLGARVEVFFKEGQLDNITDVLELAADPSFPWNPANPSNIRPGATALWL